MIETKKMTIKNTELDEAIKTEKVFDWSAQDKEIGSYKTQVMFQRETEVPYYSKMVELEKRWHKEMDISYIIVYILLGIAMLFLSSAGIFRLVFSNIEYSNIITFALLGVGLLVFACGAVLSFLKIKKVQKVIPTYFEKRRELSIQMDELRKNEKHN